MATKHTTRPAALTGEHDRGIEMIKIKQFNGSVKQQSWAADIGERAGLTPDQEYGLLWWGGPTARDAGICDAQIVIDNRHDLARYADSLIAVSKMTAEERRELAEDAVGVARSVIKSRLS